MSPRKGGGPKTQGSTAYVGAGSPLATVWRALPPYSLMSHGRSLRRLWTLANKGGARATPFLRHEHPTNTQRAPNEHPGELRRAQEMWRTLYRYIYVWGHRTKVYAPTHIYIYRVCAYRFFVRDLWLIVDVPQVARVCLCRQLG